MIYFYNVNSYFILFYLTFFLELSLAYTVVTTFGNLLNDANNALNNGDAYMFAYDLDTNKGDGFQWGNQINYEEAADVVVTKDKEVI